MNRKLVSLFAALGALVIVVGLAGCGNEEIKPDDHTQKLMDEQRTAQMGGNRAQPPGSNTPPGAPANTTAPGAAAPPNSGTGN